MKNFFTNCYFQKFFSLTSLLWLFAGGQVFLFISRIQGFWFEGFYSVLTGVLLFIVISSTVLLRERFSIKSKTIVLFFYFIVSIFVPITLSKHIQNANPTNIHYLIRYLPMVVAPGVWGCIFYKHWINEKYFFIACMLLLLFANIYLFKYYSSTFSSSFRIGTEANAISLTYAIAYLWIFIISWMLLKKQFFLAASSSLLALSNVFILSTRQSVVFLVAALFFLWLFNKRSVLYINKTFSLFSSKIPSKKWRIIPIYIFLTFFIFYLIIFTLDEDNTISTSLRGSINRWSIFFEGTSSGRTAQFKNAFDVWKNNMLYGEFLYEIGSRAHNTIMDILAQYGFIGGICYFFLIATGLRHIFVANKETMLSLAFSAIFPGLLLIGMMVTSLTMNTTFHFLLFYWASCEKKVS